MEGEFDWLNTFFSLFLVMGLIMLLQLVLINLQRQASLRELI